MRSGLDRRRQMAVADMPGKFGEMARVAGANVVELLTWRDDLHEAAIVERQQIALTERQRFRKIDQQSFALPQVYLLAPKVALVVGQNSYVERRLALTIGRTNDGGGTQKQWLLLSFMR